MFHALGVQAYALGVYMRVVLLYAEAMTVEVQTKVLTANEAVGREVRSWLGRLGLSQTRLAQVLGYTQPQVSRRLRGSQSFRFDELLVIADFMDITLGELLGSGLVNEKNPHLLGADEGSGNRRSAD